MDLVDFVQAVYPLHQVDCGEKALKQLEYVANALNRQHARRVQIEELSEQLIGEHLLWMRREGKAPDTRHRRRVHLLTMWRVACKAGWNSHEFWRAEIPKIKKSNSQPVAWSLADLDAMLRQAENVRCFKFGPKCWKALILLIYFTGLRISAALKLKRSDLHGRLLIVPHEIQKNKGGQSFNLPNDVAALLLSLPRTTNTSGGQMLIPWPWIGTSVQRRFYVQILKPAGLPNDPKLKFHAIRKTVATIVAAKSGKEVAMRVMGHSDIKVTERYLADPSSVDPSLKSSFSPQDVLPRLDAI